MLPTVLDHPPIDAISTTWSDPTCLPRSRHRRPVARPLPAGFKSRECSGDAQAPVGEECENAKQSQAARRPEGLNCHTRGGILKGTQRSPRSGPLRSSSSLVPRSGRSGNAPRERATSRRVDLRARMAARRPNDHRWTGGGGSGGNPARRAPPPSGRANLTAGGVGQTVGVDLRWPASGRGGAGRCYRPTSLSPRCRPAT